MLNARNTTILLLSAALIAGCSARSTQDDEDAARRAAERAAAEEREEARRRAEAAEAAALAERERLRADPLNDPDSILAQRVVYFDFDRSDIKPEFVAILQAHAQHLAQNPNLRVTLEGHADERGSREYNIGLGNRRAQAVRRMMMLHGVADGQITTVSYGEERPVAMGQNEAAWARNRRVEIDYSAR